LPFSKNANYNIQEMVTPMSLPTRKVIVDVIAPMATIRTPLYTMLRPVKIEIDAPMTNKAATQMRVLVRNADQPGENTERSGPLLRWQRPQTNWTRPANDPATRIRPSSHGRAFQSPYPVR
jgi:hypothetical protein